MGTYVSNVPATWWCLKDFNFVIGYFDLNISYFIKPDYLWVNVLYKDHNGLLKQTNALPLSVLNNSDLRVYSITYSF